MWAIGRTSAILSLSGHSSPVECVGFDPAEEVVVAGSATGTIKLWDLEEAKVHTAPLFISLPPLFFAHSSLVECVGFDPAEEVVVAGSATGTIKLWDLEEAKVFFAPFP